MDCDGVGLHYGTQNASHLGMLVARANLGALTPDVYQHLELVGDQIERGINDLLSQHHRVGHVQRVGGMFQIFFGAEQPIADYRDFCRLADRPQFQQFAWSLLRHGVYLSPSYALHSVLSAAHQPSDITAVLEIVDEVLKQEQGE